MVPGIGAHTDPVFWWWEENGRSRVVLLTDAVLLLSGPLTSESVAELEEARRGGTVHEADFGVDSKQVGVDTIEHLRYLPDAHRLELDLAGGDLFAIQPPRSNAGVALGVFDTLAKRLAPGAEPVDSRIDAGPTAEDPALTLVGALVVLGLVCLGLAVAADQGEPTGPLAGLRSTLNDAFEQAGYLPALTLFVIAAAVQIRRMRRGPADDKNEVEVGSRMLSLDVGAVVDGSTVPSDPLAGVAAPNDDSASWEPAESAAATGTGWEPPAASASWEDASDAWSAPEHAEVESDPAHTDDVSPPEPVDEPADPWAEEPVADASVAWTEEHVEDTADPWAEEPVAESSVAWTEEPEAEHVEDTADTWAEERLAETVDTWTQEPSENEAEPVAADVEAEFWARGKDKASDGPWWERDDAEELGDPEVLPAPADHEEVEAPVSIAPDEPSEPVEPAAETPAVDEHVPIPEPVAEVPPVEDLPAPEPVAEVAPTADDDDVFEAIAAAASMPDPDSPFAEILDREAPMPAWASAPEPTTDVVDRSAMDRSVPASLRVEPAEVD